MSYRVEYAGGSALPRQQGRTGVGFQIMTAAFLLVFVITVRCLWPQGRAVLQRWLLPGDVEPAISAFVTDLADGASFEDSFGAFCQEVFALEEDSGE